MDASTRVGAALRSPGRPLEAAVRAFFEPRFGRDFRGVRVHTGPDAEQAVRALDAEAFAIGPHLVFDPSRFAPGTPQGRRLLAHELTHVVQQSAAAGNPVVRRQKTHGAASCPGYGPGEEAKSKQEPGVLSMPVVELKPDTLLVADFGVDWRHVKPATTSDPGLQRWLGLASSAPNGSFAATGFSDCVGGEGNNEALRLGRAKRVAELVRGRTKLTCTAEAAPPGATVGNNATQVGRAMNRGVTIRVNRPAPPKPWSRPDSVAEMQDLLDDAEGLLTDPVLLSRRERQRLYGSADLKPQPLPRPGDKPTWTPDVDGALKRLDAVLDFVKPLVDPGNISRHGAQLITPSNVGPGNLTGRNVKATVLGLYDTTDWLDTAKRNVSEIVQARAVASTDPHDLVIKAKSLLAFQAKGPLKALNDEGLSFELELGSSPRPAPEYRSDLRARFPALPNLSRREVRVLAWLQDNKDPILRAESKFHVDRRAIAAAIAWEAMENIMRGSPHSAGPGKMHTYKHDLAAVLPVPKGEALPQQLEAAGLVPTPKSDDDREAILRMPEGSITYIAAAMRAAADIASRNGYDISQDLVALTSFYQGYDLPKWTVHMAEKKAKAEPGFVAVDAMAVWTQFHVDYLETAVGRPPKAI